MRSLKSKIMSFIVIILAMAGCGDDAPAPEGAPQEPRPSESKKPLAYARVLRAAIPQGFEEIPISSAARKPGETRVFLCHNPSDRRMYVEAFDVPTFTDPPRSYAEVGAQRIASFITKPDTTSEWMTVDAVKTTPAGAYWYSYVYRPAHGTTTAVFNGFRKVGDLQGVVMTKVEVDVEDRAAAEAAFLTVLDSLRVEDL
jgi:hypothetical protein